jgi:hypothetical protein
MIEYYYAEIYKKFQNYKDAIEAYSNSIKKLQDLNIKQRKIREQANLSKYVGSVSLLLAPKVQKKDQHELICRVKIV